MVTPLFQKVELVLQACNTSSSDASLILIDQDLSVLDGLTADLDPLLHLHSEIRLVSEFCFHI